ncbi:hypothetical protein BZA05DRAFT_397572, partial [Tricharina praecox]|uniref:uncharacterized protein n=1 Tax=Tricharina praecox TaxID=43433 RepID=UPI00221E6C83
MWVVRFGITSSPRTSSRIPESPGSLEKRPDTKRTSPITRQLGNQTTTLGVRHDCCRGLSDGPSYHTEPDRARTTSCRNALMRMRDSETDRLRDTGYGVTTGGVAEGGMEGNGSAFFPLTILLLLLLLCFLRFCFFFFFPRTDLVVALHWQLHYSTQHIELSSGSSSSSSNELLQDLIAQVTFSFFLSPLPFPFLFLLAVQVSRVGGNQPGGRRDSAWPWKESFLCSGRPDGGFLRVLLDLLVGMLYVVCTRTVGNHGAGPEGRAGL